MKEIIYHVTATIAGRATFNAEAGITQNQVLGVINKTTGKVIYTPLKYSKMSMSQSTALSDGSRNYTLYFGSSLPPVAVGDNLLIKIYSDASSDLVADFFGIVETPDEDVMSESEAIGILEDTWLAVTGSAAPHTDDWDGSGSGSGE